MYNKELADAILTVLDEAYPDQMDLANIKSKLSLFSSLEDTEWLKAMKVLGDQGRIKGHPITADQFHYPIDWRDVQITQSQPKTIQGNALRVLQAIYNLTRDHTNPVFVTELNIDLSEEESKAAWRYLKDKGLIETFNLDYTARINGAGVDAIENAERQSQVFPLVTYNVVNIGTAHHSSFQQAGAQSTQSQVITYGSQELSDLSRLVTELTIHLNELDIAAPQKRKAEAQISTLKAQLTDEPNPVIVQQAGHTLRNITEGAIASLLATAAQQPTVWHWIHQTMATLFK